MLQSAIKICLQQDTISGFSYSFSKALLEKLKKLREEDKLFKEGKLTLLAYSISTHLDEQINPMKKALQDMSDISGFEALIQVAEEFLTIFENAPINLDTSLYALGFSPRVWNGLVELKIKTISDLTNTPSSQLLKQRSFGKTCLQEVRNILKANGLFLKNE
ncbi:MAG: DNA-directed RNA polymerase subunit alpha C-terminal domain-containing protein, partial [Candidatus Nanoarchaeia archaeon]